MFRMEFDEVIRARKSCRRYKSKVPSWRDIVEAINYASKIPYAGNIHNIKFILVEDTKILDEISDFCQQDVCNKVHFAVVVVSETKELERSYDERGMKYIMEQGGAAVNQLLLKLVDVGLDGCWLGSFDDDKIKHALKIPEEGVIVHAVVPIGYGMSLEKGKRKPGIDKVLRFNNYEEKRMRPPKSVEGR
jgi:nitroreductase